MQKIYKDFWLTKYISKYSMGIASLFWTLRVLALLLLLSIRINPFFKEKITFSNKNWPLDSSSRLNQQEPHNPPVPMGHIYEEVDQPTSLPYWIEAQEREQNRQLLTLQETCGQIIHIQ